MQSDLPLVGQCRCDGKLHDKHDVPLDIAKAKVKCKGKGQVQGQVQRQRRSMHRKKREGLTNAWRPNDERNVNLGVFIRKCGGVGSKARVTITRAQTI
jgi:hypothetical protein